VLSAFTHEAEVLTRQFERPLSEDQRTNLGYAKTDVIDPSETWPASGDVVGPDGRPAPFEAFTLSRPRHD